MARFETSDVRRYYDRQTAGFVSLGQGGAQGAIHRAVWGHGVTTRDQAFHFVEDRIAELLTAGARAPEASPRSSDTITTAQVPHVIDLGCGVGGSLCYLAQRLSIRGTGITLSPVQARVANERIRAEGLSDRVTVLEGDFTHLPAEVPPADLAFAIEAFVHAPSAERFFAECARIVRPGGWLVICDDVRRTSDGPRAQRAVEQFVRGWRVNTLVTREQLHAHAAAAGFVHDATTDLTPWLELDRPRDRAIAAFVRMFGWLPLARTGVAHVVGGSALQTCLKRGWVAYELARFRRAGLGA